METCFLADGIWEQETGIRQVSQLLLKEKKFSWRSLPETEISILGSIEQMRLGRNANIKIAVGGKRTIYCF